MTLPEIVWEASFGIYLTFKGFKHARPVEAHRSGHAPALAGA
jgi:hypothetical protein